jgi:hypothetical protein
LMVFKSGHGRVQTFGKLFSPGTAVSGVLGSFFSWTRPCADFWEAFFVRHGRVRTFTELFFRDTAVSRLLGSFSTRTRRWPDLGGWRFSLSRPFPSPAGNG